MRFDIELLAQSAAFMLPIIRANLADALVLLGFAVCTCGLVWLPRR